MQLAALYQSSGFTSCSNFPRTPTPLSPIACVNHTPRPHEIIAISGAKRHNESHLRRRIDAIEDLAQTVHVLPSPTVSPGDIPKYSVGPLCPRRMHTSTKSRMAMEIGHSSTIKAVEFVDEPVSPVQSQCSNSSQRQRPQSAVLLSATPVFEESPDFANYYIDERGNSSKRPVLRRRSTSEERSAGGQSKLQPRDAHCRERGNTNDLILFLQTDRLPLTPDTLVDSDNPPCGHAVVKPISSLKAASTKFSQFVHPKPVTVLALTSPTSQDVANGQKKTKVVTKFYSTKRINGKMKRSPFEIREKMASRDFISRSRKFDGLVDLNAVENMAQRGNSSSSEDAHHVPEASQSERWNRWNQCIGQFGSADKFADQVNAAISAEVDQGGKPRTANIHDSKHDLPDFHAASNFRQDHNNANNIPVTEVSFRYPDGKAVLGVSRAPRRKGTVPIHEVSNTPTSNDLQRPVPTTNDLPEFHHNGRFKPFNGQNSEDNASKLSAGPATQPISLPPRVSSRPSSRTSTQASRQGGGLLPSIILDNIQTKQQPSPGSPNEDFLTSRDVAGEPRLAIPEGPAASASTLSVIESQAVPTSPRQSSNSSFHVNLENNQNSTRAYVPTPFQSKTKAPTEPPMGPLPELPEGHDRSDATPGASVRSQRTSRQAQRAHVRNNSSLTYASLSRATSPSFSYRLQSSPQQPGSNRSSNDRSTSLSNLETVFNPTPPLTAKDVVSPTSVMSIDSISNTSQTSRADRVRARKLRDTASIRARNENRALEEREARASQSPAPGESPLSQHLDQFPSIPLPVANNQGSLGQQVPIGRSGPLRHRSSFLRSNSLNLRPPLSKSPIFVVAESDPQTSRWKTSYRSPSTTPTSPGFGTDITAEMKNRPVRQKRSELSMQSKGSVTRNGAQTPPRSDTSIASDDEHRSSPKPGSAGVRIQDADQSSREMLEQRVQRLESENKRYRAMIMAWLDPEHFLHREISMRSFATTETAGTRISTFTAATVNGQDLTTATTTTTNPGYLPSANSRAGRRPDSYQSGKHTASAGRLSDDQYIEKLIAGLGQPQDSPAG